MKKPIQPLLDMKDSSAWRALFQGTVPDASASRALTSTPQANGLGVQRALEDQRRAGALRWVGLYRAVFCGSGAVLDTYEPAGVRSLAVKIVVALTSGMPKVLGAAPRCFCVML